MATLIDIANSALVKIGAKTILSLEDDCKEANLCKTRYEAIKRIVLRMHPWNCAIKRVALAPVVGTPAYEFTYAFNLPGGSLRLLEVADDVEFRIEGKQILANTSVLNIKYIDDVADPSQLDELCAEAISCYIAWDLAYALTQSNTAREFAWKQFEMVKRSAKSVDAQEERDHVLEASLFIDSRIGRTGP